MTNWMDSSAVNTVKTVKTKLISFSISSHVGEKKKKVFTVFTAFTTQDAAFDGKLSQSPRLNLPQPLDRSLKRGCLVPVLHGAWRDSPTRGGRRNCNPQLVVTPAKEAGAMTETTTCPSCGFSRLRPADDAAPPRLVWTCEIAGQECRYIARDRDRPQKKAGKRVKA